MSLSTNPEPVRLSPEERTFFDTQGYLKAEKVLEGEDLARVQEEFYRVEQTTWEDWRRQVEGEPDYNAYGIGETAHVVFPIAPHGNIFVDLLEHPRTMSVAEAFMGPDVQMSDNALHVKPAGTKSHTVWHRDATTWDYTEAEAWSAEDGRVWKQVRACETPFYKVKIFFFVEDVDEDTAPFSVVPGSHKFDDNDKVPRYDRLEDMPDYVRLVGQAGDAILWNGCIWHTAMDNTDTKARRMLLYNYIHFGQAQHGPCVPTGEFAEYVRGRSRLCQQLFGLERMPRG